MNGIIILGICLIIFLSLAYPIAKKSKEEDEKTKRVLTKKCKDQIFQLCDKGVTFEEINELLDIPVEVISDLMKEYYEKKEENKRS